MSKQYNWYHVVVGMIVICLSIGAYPRVASAQVPGFDPFHSPMAGITIDLDQDVTLPALTGPYQTIGRTSFNVADASRNDLYVPDGVTGPREFTVWVHYPAMPPAAGTPTAPYLPAPLDFLMAQGMVTTKDPASFAHIKPHACENLPVSTAQAVFPVILFSHGLNLHPLFYTAMLEELASQGYIVVSVTHPHDAPVVVLPPNPGDSMPFRVLTPPVGNENTLVNAAYNGDPNALNALNMYEFTSRPGDVLFTLGKLLEMNMLDPLFAGRLDLSNVGLLGHSFGAATVAWASQAYNQFEATNPLKALTQIKAVTIMDSVQLPLATDPSTPPLTQATLFMSGALAEANSPILPPGYVQTVQQMNCLNVGYLMQSLPFYFFELATSTHIAYVSDLLVIAPFLVNFDPYQGTPIIGFNGGNALQKILIYLDAFFNHHLQQIPQPVLSEMPSAYPKVLFMANPLNNPACLPPPVVTPTLPPNAIPEPGTFVLVGLGLAGIIAFFSRKRHI